MFNNKKIEELEQRINKLEGYNIPDRLTQLECDHSDISFETISKRKVSNIYTGTSLLYKWYSKVCKKCGKILKSYLSESHCLWPSHLHYQIKEDLPMSVFPIVRLIFACLYVLSNLQSWSQILRVFLRSPFFLRECYL